MKTNYFIHILRSIPLLPIIYFQGKRIKRQLQILPEAKNPQGSVDINADKSLTILFIGESSFAGLGSDFHKNSFAGHFSKELSFLIQCNIDWKVYAKTGYNVEKIHQRIIPKIPETHCDLLVLGIGANDSFELTLLKNWQKNVQLLIIALRNKFSETPILFVQLPTIEVFPALTKQMQFVLGNHKNLLVENLHKITLENGNIYFTKEEVDIEKWMNELNDNQTIRDFFSDGIHPSEITYRLWAQESAKFLVDCKVNFS
ncbi:SGNH/GDSL hydrolase family protein [Chryseobacterium sp. SNU WT5]|uniref:SGNH/GDSL hydrolase family protein n=1 Tax=Chryseobacterium sp. SNU WT5 TaxID=2594269 RepID=UPI00117F76FE|nr:SGNH/GDSL hydrolase family protein [Chryseobacterium sp. SNU WT5]QDP84039.1 SGNH/GDSL hydrolase family protein [Chryseobacterium sp. SNU WT5]